jgi:hypothetical protein
VWVASNTRCCGSLSIVASLETTAHSTCCSFIPPIGPSSLCAASKRLSRPTCFSNEFDVIDFMRSDRRVNRERNRVNERRLTIHPPSPWWSCGNFGAHQQSPRLFPGKCQRPCNGCKTRPSNVRPVSREIFEMFRQLILGRPHLRFEIPRPITRTAHRADRIVGWLFGLVEVLI